MDCSYPGSIVTLLQKTSCNLIHGPLSAMTFISHRSDLDLLVGDKDIIHTQDLSGFFRTPFVHRLILWEG